MKDLPFTPQIMPLTCQIMTGSGCKANLPLIVV